MDHEKRIENLRAAADNVDLARNGIQFGDIEMSNLLMERAVSELDEVMADTDSLLRRLALFEEVALEGGGPTTDEIIEYAEEMDIDINPDELEEYDGG